MYNIYITAQYSYIYITAQYNYIKLHNVTIYMEQSVSAIGRSLPNSK